jgi:selenide,water dikinase
VEDKNLLVGIHTGDDAAVYQVREDLCLVQTVDFFPPIVDDPYDFGSIAVANALSDVYAMGATPVLGLNLVCFPENLDMGVLKEILRGGAEKAQEAGVLVAGGHTIKDKEPKYGMAVTGLAHPHAIVTNAKARPGDVLVLTKALGTGILSTAGKSGRVRAEEMESAVAQMKELNREPAEAMVKVGVNGCTDVTGFGLLGHLRGMMEASTTTAQVRVSAVPVLAGTHELLEEGVAPGGTRDNLKTLRELTTWHPEVTEPERLLLCDAQTSGGLLISVPQERAGALLTELAARGASGSVIGEVKARGEKALEVLP